MGATAAVVGEFIFGSAAEASVAEGVAAGLETAGTVGTLAEGGAAAYGASAVGGVLEAGAGSALGLGTASEVVKDYGSTALGAASLAMQKGPPTPQVQKPTPIPDAKAQEDARRRSLAEQQARRGRASTILTGTSDTLGG